MPIILKFVENAVKNVIQILIKHKNTNLNFFFQNSTTVGWGIWDIHRVKSHYKDKVLLKQ